MADPRLDDIFYDEDERFFKQFAENVGENALWMKIARKVGEEALWMQLAEEAAELSQAASKVARCIHGTNPVYVNGMEVKDDDNHPSLKTLEEYVSEEFGDVCLIADILGVYDDPNIVKSKLERWGKRLGLDTEE